MPSFTAESACCNAPVRAVTGDEGTSYYLCTNCQNPCDLASLHARSEATEMPTYSPDEALRIRVEALFSLYKVERNEKLIDALIGMINDEKEDTNDKQ